MSIKIYYVIEKELQSIGDSIEETTGNKTVSTYTIEHGELKAFFDLELSNNENSEEMINQYLKDNGYGEKDCKLVIL